MTDGPVRHQDHGSLAPNAQAGHPELVAVDEAGGLAAGSGQRSQLPRGVRLALAALTLLLVGGLALLAYLSVGVATVARRAQGQVVVIDRALDQLPLPPTSERGTFRTPDGTEARTAVRAQRLGALAYFFYCGDQCPSWNPGDPVEVVRYGDVAPPERGDAACQEQDQLLGARAGLHEVPGDQAGTPVAFCSFAGCMGSVGVRVDFYGNGQVERFRVRGVIGNPGASSADQVAHCGKGP